MRIIIPERSSRQAGGFSASRHLEWAQSHGAVFEKTTFFEIALLMHLGQFDRLVDRHYAGGGSLDVSALSALFEKRAKRTEMSYEDYEFRYLPGLRQRVRDLVESGAYKDENRGYVHQAHCKPVPVTWACGHGPRNSE